MEAVVVAVIGLVSTVVATTLLEIVKKGLNKAKEKDDLATDMRNEVRGDLKACKLELVEMHKEIDKLDAQIDQWREKYYLLVAEHSLCKACSSPLCSNSVQISEN